MILETQVKAINLESHVFVKPKKEIHLPEDIGKKWEKSEVIRNYEYDMTFCFNQSILVLIDFDKRLMFSNCPEMVDGWMDIAGSYHVYTVL